MTAIYGNVYIYYVYMHILNVFVHLNIHIHRVVS